MVVVFFFFCLFLSHYPPSLMFSLVSRLLRLLTAPHRFFSFLFFSFLDTPNNAGIFVRRSQGDGPRDMREVALSHTQLRQGLIDMSTVIGGRGRLFNFFKL